LRPRNKKKPRPVVTSSSQVRNCGASVGSGKSCLRKTANGLAASFDGRQGGRDLREMPRFEVHDPGTVGCEIAAVPG